MAPREELPFQVKRYIVQRLARHETPSQVARAVKEDFQLELSRQRVEYYDPTSRAGAALDPSLKALFEETRAAFLKDLDAIPIANKAVQLRALDRALTVAEERKQLPLIVSIVQAAADLAGTVTKKVQVEHKGGIEVSSARERLASRLNAIAERRSAGVAAASAAAGVPAKPH